VLGLASAGDDTEATVLVVRDAVGRLPAGGDTVAVVRDLTATGSATAITVDPTVRTIRLGAPVDGHDIDGQVDGVGPIQPKWGVVTTV
jgi:protein PhnA